MLIEHLHRLRHCRRALDREYEALRRASVTPKGPRKGPGRPALRDEAERYGVAPRILSAYDHALDQAWRSALELDVAGAATGRFLNRYGRYCHSYVDRDDVFSEATIRLRSLLPSVDPARLRDDQDKVVRMVVHRLAEMLTRYAQQEQRYAEGAIHPDTLVDSLEDPWSFSSLPKAGGEQGLVELLDVNEGRMKS